MAQPLRIDALYEEHRRFLWGLCYRMTGSAADAEDVVHDTFVRAIEHPPGRTNEPLRPWLAKVALNLARDLLRRRRRRDYIGPWLPSPIETGSSSQGASRATADLSRRSAAGAEAIRLPTSPRRSKAATTCSKVSPSRSSSRSND